MRYLPFLSACLFTCSLYAADNTELLSSFKQEQLKIDKQQNKLTSDNLKNDWISPITGSWSWSKTEDASNEQDTSTFSLAYDQPIFKSGGIYFAIRYADANREFLKLSTDLNKQTQIKQVMSDFLRIKRIELQIERMFFQIENAKIDIIRKKEQYESGFADSSDLDQAILSKSNLEHSLLDLESSKLELMKDFETISGVQFETLKLPTFNMVEEDKFLNSSINIKQQQSNVVKTRWLQKATTSNQYATVSINAKHTDVSGSTTDDSYQTFGLKLSMPLFSINRSRTIELARLDTLEQASKLNELKHSEKKAYETTYENVKLLEKKRELSVKDYDLYSSLLHSTEDLANAGEKTPYDVDTLKNSRETMLIDQRLYETDIQIALLNLYAKMHGEI